MEKIDEISGKITTTGNTKIDTHQSKITGSKLDLKLDSETGQIDDATFEFKDKSGKTERTIMQFGHPVTQRLYTYRGEAKTIFFEGENRKKLETSKITTCEVDNQDWFIKTSSLNIEQNINKKLNGITIHTNIEKNLINPKPAPDISINLLSSEIPELILLKTIYE